MYGFYYNIDWASKSFAFLGSDLFELVVVIIRHLHGCKELLAAISGYPKFSQGQTHRICSSDIWDLGYKVAVVEQSDYKTRLQTAKVDS